MPPSSAYSPPNAAEVAQILRSRILVDGFPFVLDLAESHGSYLRDKLSGRDFVDFYSLFASQPIGYNHPRMHAAEFNERLLLAARTKVANPDMYTPFYADFVRTFEEVAGLPGFEHFFFVDGGALAVENALKAAFDWKVRKNLAAGRGETGYGVIHFKQSFHGRSGYTLSLTNTHDRRKTMYFPKFDWPRIDNPRIDFSLKEPERSHSAANAEQLAIVQIERAIAAKPHEIAALIIEPIQSEGGDNHFRGEFLAELRDICDRQDILLIFDEVQTGVGITGRMWCCQHFGVYPDIICFGKKTQICGIMANRRIDELAENVFSVPSRINSTFGGNLADMVRSTEYLRIIRDENMVAQAAASGAYLLERIAEVSRRHSHISAPRGRGLMCAFDLPDTTRRDALRKACFERGLLVLACGERTIRFRPVLNIERAAIDAGMQILDETLNAI